MTASQIGKGTSTFDDVLGVLSVAVYPLVEQSAPLDAMSVPDQDPSDSLELLNSLLLKFQGHALAECSGGANSALPPCKSCTPPVQILHPISTHYQRTHSQEHNKAADAAYS